MNVEEAQPIMTEWTDLPTCPSCGCEFQDWYDGIEPKGDGDIWQMECDCGCTFQVVLAIATLFQSLLIDRLASGYGDHEGHQAST